MDMAIVIPTAGRRADLLDRTLRSLADCSLPEAFRETIVIENGAQHGIEVVVEHCAPHLRARYIFEPCGNKSAALNVVLERFDHDLLIFMDDDIRVIPELPDAYVRAAQAHGRGHYFGGPFDCDYEALPESLVVPYLPASARGWRLPEGRMALQEDEYFIGFNWAAFTADLRAAGGFDTLFGPGSALGATGQETVMQKRLRATGAIAIYVRRALAWHYVPRERSSRDWALNRQFRNGVGGALMHDLFPAGRKGWIKYTIVRLGRSCRLYVLGLLTFSPAKRFAARANLAEWRGIRRGLAMKDTTKGME